MAEKVENVQGCAHPHCDRPPALDPPFCCLPCEVATRPGVPHLHSVTCQKTNKAGLFSEPDVDREASGSAG